MKRLLHVGILFLLVSSILAGLAVAQTQTGKIKVVGVPDRFKSANKNQATYGLKSIGWVAASFWPPWCTTAPAECTPIR